MKHVLPPLVIPPTDLKPFVDTLVSCPCGAAAGGVCLVGTKALIWSAYPHLPRANRILGELSQAVCDEAGMPLLILLNGAGAALFEPQKRAQRILPISAYDRFGPNCSFGLSFEQVIYLLKAEPKPFETLGAFVRRMVSDASSMR